MVAERRACSLSWAPKTCKVGCGICQLCADHPFLKPYRKLYSMPRTAAVHPCVHRHRERPRVPMPALATRPTIEQPFFVAPDSALGERLRTWCPAQGRNHRSLSLERNLARLPAKSLLLDIGAFDGGDAISFARSGGHRVLSFEPSPTKQDAISALLTAANLSAAVTLHWMALSNFTGASFFEVMPMPKGNQKLYRMLRGAMHRADSKGRHQIGSAQDRLLPLSSAKASNPTYANGSLDADGAFANQSSDLQSGSRLVSVPVCTLDSVLTNDEQVAFAKLDAQGHDLRVLLGSRRLLRERRLRRFVFEFCPSCMPGGQREASELLAFLQAERAACVACNDRTTAMKVLRPTPIDVYVDAFRRRGEHTGKGYDNIVCELLDEPRPARLTTEG